jgi:hypothetical protein
LRIHVLKSDYVIVFPDDFSWNFSRYNFFKNRHGSSSTFVTASSESTCEQAARPGEKNFGRAGISARNN